MESGPRRFIDDLMFQGRAPRERAGERFLVDAGQWRAHARGFRGQVFDLERAFLDRFADFAIASNGFRLT